jgi:hypothetical protein
MSPSTLSSRFPLNWWCRFILEYDTELHARLCDPTNESQPSECSCDQIEQRKKSDKPRYVDIK